MPIKLIAFAGSARRMALNKKLARIAAQNAQSQGVEASFIDLANFPIPLYNADLAIEGSMPENLKQLKDLIRAHDAIFIASPEYNANVSPLLKNTIDWLSHQFDGEENARNMFKNRIWGIASVSSSPLSGVRGLMALRQTLSSLSAIIVGEQTMIKCGQDAFDTNEQLKDQRTAHILSEQIKRMIEIATALKQERRHDSPAGQEKSCCNKSA